MAMIESEGKESGTCYEFDFNLYGYVISQGSNYFSEPFSGCRRGIVSLLLTSLKIYFILKTFISNEVRWTFFSSSFPIVFIFVDIMYCFPNDKL